MDGEISGLRLETHDDQPMTIQIAHKKLNHHKQRHDLRLHHKLDNLNHLKDENHQRPTTKKMKMLMIADLTTLITQAHIIQVRTIQQIRMRRSLGGSGTTGVREVGQVVGITTTTVMEMARRWREQRTAMFPTGTVSSLIVRFTSGRLISGAQRQESTQTNEHCDYFKN